MDNTIHVLLKKTNVLGEDGTEILGVSKDFQTLEELAQETEVSRTDYLEIKSYIDAAHIEEIEFSDHASKNWGRWSE